MELVISSVLQLGVAVSSVIILIGIILFFTQYNHSLNSSYHAFTSASYSFPHSLNALKIALQQGRGIGYIELGVLLLILTPAIRVATSIMLFLRQHDLPMTYVTLFVLLVLVGSFYIGIVAK